MPLGTGLFWYPVLDKNPYKLTSNSVLLWLLLLEVSIAIVIVAEVLSVLAVMQVVKVLLSLSLLMLLLKLMYLSSSG